MATTSSSIRPDRAQPPAKPLASLRAPAEFSAVFEKAQACRSGAVAARAARRAPSGPVRLGLVVPKKKTKSAALRNAFKRVAREAARALLREDPRAAGVDFVVQFFGQPPASPADFKAQARSDVDSALRLALARTAPPQA